MNFNITVKAITSSASKSLRNLGKTIENTGGKFAGFYARNRRVNQSLSNISKDANRARDGFKGMTNAFTGLNQVLDAGKLYVFANTLAGAIQASMDSIETVNLFSLAMGDLAVETDKTVKEMVDLTGLDYTNLQNSVATFGLLARSMGMTSKQANILSVNTSKLAIDLSSAMNVPIQQVMADLRSGLIGQSETVYKYGIDVTEAGIAQEALNQGITKSVRNMSQGEKMALRYSVMLRQTGITHGDFANTIDQPSNQLRILRERFVNLSRAVGSIFIPALSAILPYANAVVIVLTRVAEAIAKFFGYEAPKVKDATSGLSDINTGFEDTADSVDGATESIKAFKSNLMGFDEINLLPQDTADTPSKGGGGAGMGDSILQDMDLGSYDSGLTKIKSRADEIAQSMINMGMRIKEALNDIPLPVIIALGAGLGAIVLAGSIPIIAGWFLDLAVALAGLGKLPVVGKVFAFLSETALSAGSAIEGLGTTLAGLGGGTIALIVGAIALVVGTVVDLWKTSESFRDSWKKVWANIKDVLKTVFDKIIKPVLGIMIELCKDIWNDGLKPLYNEWKKTFESISDFVTTAINIILPVLSWLVDKLSYVVIPVVKLVAKVFKTQFDIIVGVVRIALKIIGGLFKILEGTLKGVVKFLKGVFTGDWKMAFEGLSDIVDTVIETVGDVFKGIVDVFKDVIKNIEDNATDLKEAFLAGFDGVFKKFKDDVVKPIQKAWTSLEDLNKAIIVKFSAYIATKADEFKEKWSNLVEPAKDKIASFSAKIITLASTIKTGWDNLAKIWLNKNVSFSAKISTTWSTIKTGWDALASAWKDKTASYKIAFGMGIQWLRDWWTYYANQWKDRTASFKIAFGMGIQWLRDWWIYYANQWKDRTAEFRLHLSTTIGDVRNFINNLIDSLNANVISKLDFGFSVPKWLGGGWWEWSAPRIPRLARGGMLDQGQFFEAGEFGKAEMIGSYQGKTTVMPLENTSFVQAMHDAVFNAVSSAIPKSNGSDSGDLILKVGKDELGRIAISSINAVTRREGKVSLQL